MWAIITGGSSGLGLAIAKRLASEGYDIILVSRSADKLEKAGEAIRAKVPCVRVLVHSIDLSQKGAAEELYEWTSEAGIVPHILVNDAGAYLYKPIVEVEASRQEALLNLNISALASLCRLYGALMAEDVSSEKKGGGKAAPRHILNIASYSVYMPIWGFSLYAGSKAFVKTFSRCIGKELRPLGICVTAVAPAGIDTGLMNLRPEIQRLARKAGFLASADTIARIAVRAMKNKRVRYCIPLFFNVLFIPFLWMFQPLFKKVLSGR